MILRPAHRILLAALLITVGQGGCGLGGSDGLEADEDGNFDECGGDRASGELGDVCRDDCDCSQGYSCYTDDYDEQCCARELNDLDNGVWGIDCDGVQ